MAQESQNRIVELYLALKAWTPEARQRVQDWWRTCRAEPVLFWETAAVRYGAYVLGGIIVVWVGTVLINLLGLNPPPSQVHPISTKADFHVICTNPECGAHFIIHEDKGFDDFPVRCTKCGQQTGQRAYRCFSDECKGRWVTVTIKDGQRICDRCGRALGP